MKPGSSAGAGAGGTAAAFDAAGAGAAGAEAGTISLAAIVLAAAGGEASALAVAAGAVACGAGADAAMAGPDALAGVAAGTAGGTAAVLVTAGPAPVAVDAAGALGTAPAAEPEALASLLRSLMFLDSSSTRADVSLACLRVASASGVALVPLTAPLERVSLSGEVLVVFCSCTCVCTRPLSLRPALVVSAVGAAAASLWRKALKSRLCAAMVWRASAAGVAAAWLALGRSSTAPALSRLTLPPMNASGLARSMATSIWSSDTSCGRWALAIRPAVSPAFTVTLPDDSAVAGAAERGGAAGRVGTAEACAEGAAGAGARTWGAAVTLGAGRRMAGGSNSMV